MAFGYNFKDAFEKLANALDVDAGELIKRKLALNAKKYPVDKARGNAKKHSEL